MPETSDDTPAVTELAWGGEDLAWGDELLSWGGDVSTIPVSVVPRLLPEQVVVAAARSIELSAFPVVEIVGKGAAPTLPSVTFQSTGSVEQDGFQKTITAQTVIIAVRHASYGGLVQLTWQLYQALKRFPSGRVRQTSGFSDGFDDDFGVYVRTFTALIQR